MRAKLILLIGALIIITVLITLLIVHYPPFHLVPPPAADEMVVRAYDEPQERECPKCGTIEIFHRKYMKYQLDHYEILYLECPCGYGFYMECKDSKSI